jgi:hypothetical protein
MKTKDYLQKRAAVSVRKVQPCQERPGLSHCVDGEVPLEAGEARTEVEASSKTWAWLPGSFAFRGFPPCRFWWAGAVHCPGQH